MYSWLWSKLPGKWQLKALICFGLVALFLAVCYFWFFPWIDSLFFSESGNPIQ